jgi:hypothetical protein
MSTATTGPGPTDRPTLHLVRWTVTSGSNVQSRGAVVIASGDHQWEGAAEGNGPVAALYRAVDAALAGVLAGHPRLLAYDVHAVTESPDSEALVTVRIAPPETAGGGRAGGRFRAEARDENIIAASVEAYIEALNELLAGEQWAGATEAAGNRRRAETAAAAARRAARKAELDEEEGHHDVTSWFER